MRPTWKAATIVAPFAKLSGSTSVLWLVRADALHVACVNGSELTGVVAAVNGHRFLPNGGHRISPVADVFSPRWWPSGLPSAAGARGLGRRPRRVCQACR